jgi:hypothetical protein
MVKQKEVSLPCFVKEKKKGCCFVQVPSIVFRVGLPIATRVLRGSIIRGSDL